MTKILTFDEHGEDVDGTAAAVVARSASTVRTRALFPCWRTGTNGASLARMPAS